MKALTTLLLAVAAACTAVERPRADQLGARVRVRVEGREIDSILTSDCFVFFAVRTPDGKRIPMRVRAVESASAAGLSLAIASVVELRCDTGQLELAPALHGSDPGCVADMVLPAGHTLDFAPGSYLVYEIDENRQLTPTASPELRLGQIARDGSRYIELAAQKGPPMELRGRPPGFAEAR